MAPRVVHPSAFTLKDSDFRGNNIHHFLRVLDNTLRACHERNLCIDEFHAEIMRTNIIDSAAAASLLRQWVPIVVRSMRVKKFDLCFIDSKYFDLSTVVFKSEHLRHLYLSRCRCDLHELGSIHLKNLTSIVLRGVLIQDDAFEKMISGCPLVQHLYLQGCSGSARTKLHGIRNLKVFRLLFFIKGYVDMCSTSVEIDAPAVEYIRIVDCGNWSHRQIHSRRLKFLYLENVRLSTESFNGFSSNFPCMEKLHLLRCYGIERFQLSSASIKKLKIVSSKKNGAKIDAPNIVDFQYEGCIPLPFSFTTNSSCEWSSHLDLNVIDRDRDWICKLNDVLQAVSRSKIYLMISQDEGDGDGDEYPWDIVGCSSFYKPVVPEQLRLDIRGESASSLSVIVHRLFRIICPREIGECFYNVNTTYSQLTRTYGWDESCCKLTEILCKTLQIKDQKTSD